MARTKLMMMMSWTPKKAVYCDMLDTADNDTLHPALEQQDSLIAIISHLSTADRGRVAQVCMGWRNVVDSPSLWKGFRYLLDQYLNCPSDVLRRRRIRKFKIGVHRSNRLLRSSLLALFDSVPDVQDLLFTKRRITPTDAILRDTLPPSGLPHMTHLSLQNGCKLTDASVELIGQLMPNLVSLEIVRGKLLSNQALLFISERLHKLKALKLVNCRRLTMNGFDYLAGKLNPGDDVAGRSGAVNLSGRRSSIVNLTLSHWRNLSDVTLERLSGMTELRELNLNKCRNVDRRGLFHLSKMANLEVLGFTNCLMVDDAGLSHLAKMPGLRSLKVSGSASISDQGMHRLASRNTRITSLDISYCSELSSDTLHVIAGGMFHLRKLLLDQSHVSADGLLLAADKLCHLEIIRLRQLKKKKWSCYVRYVRDPVTTHFVADGIAQ